MAFDYALFCILPGSLIREAIACIDGNQKGIALVTDGERRLIGTVTDGDIRRAILRGKSLDTPVESILEHKAGVHSNARPVTAPADTSRSILLDVMHERSVRQIPLLDSTDRVIGLVTMDDLIPNGRLPVQAVIMAGGFGTRLRPLTENMPKPMLPVNGRPLMERIIEQLQQAGIRSVNVTTHYKPEKIIDHFGDGRFFGVDLKYVSEKSPLGTGGALGLIPVPEEPTFVINGDILTRVDFRAMLAFHQENGADITVGVRRYEIQVPYGVLECDGAKVNSLQEKPRVSFLVNTGIYLLEPCVYQLIPRGEHFNMTDLIQWTLDAGRSVVTFPIHEYWLDIGQHEDYIRAQQEFKPGD